MTRVGVVEQGTVFWPAVADWLAEHYSGSAVKVLVPGGRAARWLESLLSSKGVKATVVELRAEALARVCGVEMPGAVSAWKLRAEAGAILSSLLPEISAARRVGMAAELVEVMERLAVYEVDRERLKKALPEELAAHWEINAETLLKVMARVENFLGRVEGVMAGTASARVFAEVARKERGWVVAGMVDAVPSARRMVKAMVDSGAVLVPEGRDFTRGLVQVWLKELGLLEVQRERVRGRVPKMPVREVVSAGAWQEVEAVGLSVRRAVAEEKKRIAVVTPDSGFAVRLNGALARWGLRARVAGGERIVDTPAGRLWAAVLGVTGASPTDYVAWAALQSVVRVDFSKRDVWMKLPRVALATVWVEAVGKVVDFLCPDWREMDGAKEVEEAFVCAAEMHGMLDGGSAGAVLQRMLREEVREGTGSEGIWVMGPQDARLGYFDTVVCAQMVEGVWPGNSYSTWMTSRQTRDVGMPDHIKRAALMGSEFETLLGGEMVVSHTAAKDSGRVESRYLRGIERERDTEIEQLLDGGFLVREEGLGVFNPRGGQYPATWSASFVETMMACPYRAYAERILRMVPCEPIEPVPDARVGGLLVHAWLERVGSEFARVTEENREEVKKRLEELADEILRDEDAVVKAIWRPKMRTLSGALTERWLEMGRSVEVVEKEVRREVGGVLVRAIIDRVEEREGVRTVLDFKTGSVPAWGEVQSGKKPQLALEAWLLGEVDRLEYWKLRGYGREPVEISEKNAAEMVEKVEEGIGNLVAHFAEGAPFPALPDRKGGGLVATGHCEVCALSGVCRRMAEAGG